jgi:hypothetical protein
MGLNFRVVSAYRGEADGSPRSLEIAENPQLSAGSGLLLRMDFRD